MCVRHECRHRIVIASEAIQNNPSALDCFVVEPVIGLATSGRTRWLVRATLAYKI